MTSSPAAPLAVDLGTARTQVYSPEAGLLLDEPTLIAHDRHGSIVAAGRAAWETSAQTPARLRFPVRRALVVDPVDCVRFLHLLFEQAGVRADGPAMMSIPASASAYEASVLTAVLSSVTGARVTPVDSLLAAAIGAGVPVDSPHPQLVCDVGAGIAEIGLVRLGRLRRRSSAGVGTRDYLDDPQRMLGPVAWALRRVLDDVPGVVRDRATSPVLLVGGGGLVPGLAEDLAAALGVQVVVQPEPRHVVLTGLGRCAEPLLAAG